MKRRLNAGLIVAASRENKVVGYAQHGSATDSVYELFAIYVLPEVLGQGVGWELWKAVRQAARESGQPWIELWVLDRNSFGRRWYDRQGGQVVGSREIELGTEAHRELRYRFSAGLARPQAGATPGASPRLRAPRVLRPHEPIRADRGPDDPRIDAAPGCEVEFQAVCQHLPRGPGLARVEGLFEVGTLRDQPVPRAKEERAALLEPAGVNTGFDQCCPPSWVCST